MLLMALLVLGASAYTAVDILEGMPHCQDEVAYLFQARILGAGRLYLPSLPEDVRGFFDHEFIVNNGKWYGKYSPGTSALLAAGEAVSAPWAVNPLLGAASVVLVYRLGERLFSWRTGLLTAVAFAVSPFTLLCRPVYEPRPGSRPRCCSSWAFAPDMSHARAGSHVATDWPGWGWGFFSSVLQRPARLPDRRGGDRDGLRARGVAAGNGCDPSSPRGAGGVLVLLGRATTWRHG